MSGIPGEFWARVPASARWRYLLFEGHPGLETFLQGAAVLALVAAAVGVYPRLACFVAGVLLYHLAPLETLFWTASPHERGFTITVPALIALSCSRCGDVWAWKRQKPGAQPAPAWEYGWALRLVQLFLCQVYLFAGYSKLYRVGWEWVSAENMRAWMLVFSQYEPVQVFRTLGPWIAERPELCFLLAAASLAFDLGFVTVLFWRKSRLLLIPLALLFHLGIALAMNIVFLNIPQLLVFVDWHALSNLRSRLRS